MNLTMLLEVKTVGRLMGDNGLIGDALKGSDGLVKKKN